MIGYRAVFGKDRPLLSEDGDVLSECTALKDEREKVKARARVREGVEERERETLLHK